MLICGLYHIFTFITLQLFYITSSALILFSGKRTSNGSTSWSSLWCPCFWNYWLSKFASFFDIGAKSWARARSSLGTRKGRKIYWYSQLFLEISTWFSKYFVYKLRTHVYLGLLTYLGQSELERKQSDLNPWYLEARSKIYSSSTTSSNTTPTTSITSSARPSRLKDADWDAKRKRALDPLADMARYEEASKKYRASLARPTLPSPSAPTSQSRATAKQEPSASLIRAAPSAQSAVNASSSGSRSRLLEQLRAERIAREAAERARADALISRVSAARAGVPLQYSAAAEFTRVHDEREHRYNSQFNPDIARQNRPREPREWALKYCTTSDSIYTLLICANYHSPSLV